MHALHSVCQWLNHLVNDHEPHGHTHGGGDMQDTVHIVVLGDQQGPGQVDSNGMRHGEENGPYPSPEISCHIPVTAMPSTLNASLGESVTLPYNSEWQLVHCCMQCKLFWHV